MSRKYFIKIILLIMFLACNLWSAGDVFKIELKNIGSDTFTNIIEWTGINSPYSGSWKVANQYYEITYLTNHTIYTGWGLNITTTNRALDANPRYIGTGDPAGLISTLSSNLTLPLIWMAVGSPFITNISGGTQTTYPPTPVLRGDGSGFENWTWRWLMDKSSQGFTNYNENGYNKYSLVWDQAGFAYHEFLHQHMPSKIFIYFGANFSGATIQTYRTTRLLLEQFHTSDTEYLKNFWIYTNHGNIYHHYCPSGWHGSISLNTNFDDCYSSPACCKIKLGSGWAGLLWNEPAEIGDDPKGYTNKGYNLTGTRCIEFRAKSSNGRPEITFGTGRDEDSCGGTCQRDITLSTNWMLYGIKLTNKNLSHVSCGFRVTGWDKNCTFYLDDVKFKSAINPVFTHILITPNSTNVLTNHQAQFTAIGKDQYGDDITVSPNWAVSGGIGTITSGGLFTAGSSAGNGQIIASSGTVSGFANVTIVTQLEFSPFYIYNDELYNYHPTHWQGDTGNMSTDDSTIKPHSGTKCLKLTFAYNDAWWSAFWFEHPANLGGGGNKTGGEGLNLTGAVKISFWARTESAYAGQGNFGFHFGYNEDSCGSYEMFKDISFTTNWEYKEWILPETDLTDVSGGLEAWSWGNPWTGRVLYLDDIKIE